MLTGMTRGRRRRSSRSREKERCVPPLPPPALSQTHWTFAQTWAENVDKEKGSFDFLMFADIDHSHPEARKDLINWGEWVCVRLSSFSPSYAEFREVMEIPLSVNLKLINLTGRMCSIKETGAAGFRFDAVKVRFAALAVPVRLYSSVSSTVLTFSTPSRSYSTSTRASSPTLFARSGRGSTTCVLLLRLSLALLLTLSTVRLLA